MSNDESKIWTAWQQSYQVYVWFDLNSLLFLPSQMFCHTAPETGKLRNLELLPFF